MGAHWEHWAGERVRLRAIEQSDGPQMLANERDGEAERNGGWLQHPRSTESTRKRIEERAGGQADLSCMLAITPLDSDAMVGTVSARHAVPKHGTIEYGINVYRDHWRKGYAREAALLLLRHYFDELGFLKVEAGVWAYNEQSMAFHRAFGFLEEARLREAIVTRGKRYDELRFGMLAEEFNAVHADWLQRWSGP